MRIHEEEVSEEFGANLTPMIDVVFLLLIFFMLSTTFLEEEKELGIELPEAQFAAMQDAEIDEIFINVFEDGSVIMNGQKMEEDALEAALKHAARKNPETAVTIRGDRATPHGDVVRVMGACAVAGLGNLNIAALDRSDS